MCEQTLRITIVLLLKEYLIKRIHKKLSLLTEQYLDGQKPKEEIAFEVMDEIALEILPDFYDFFISDCYYTLKYLNHEYPYATTKEEVEYFHECFSGLRTHNLEEKNLYITTRWNEKKNKLE